MDRTANGTRCGRLTAACYDRRKSVNSSKKSRGFTHSFQAPSCNLNPADVALDQHAARFCETLLMWHLTSTLQPKPC